jgi:hypothetical protein
VCFVFCFSGFCAFVLCGFVLWSFKKFVICDGVESDACQSSVPGNDKSRVL